MGYSVYERSDIMKKLLTYIMSKKMVINAFVLLGGVTAMMARDGFCFYIYHQPKYPDALK